MQHLLPLRSVLTGDARRRHGAPRELVRQDTTLRDPRMHSRLYSPYAAKWTEDRGP